jgi:hypothetical protein
MFVSRRADTHVSIAALRVQENAAAARTRTTSRDAVREVIRGPVPCVEQTAPARHRRLEADGLRCSKPRLPPPNSFQVREDARMGGRPAIHDTDAVTGIH